MKHVPWPVLVTEFISWSVLSAIPLYIWFGDVSIELLWILNAVWFFWVYMHFFVPRFLTTYRVSLPKIGKYSLKIALISDLHAGPFKGVRFFKRVVKRINKECPDVILIPGDFLLGTAQKFAQKLEPLKNLCKPVFYTLGNHDHWLHNSGGKEAGSSFLRKKLKEFGLQELRNNAIKWKDGLWLVGVDDNYHGFDDLPKAFENVPNMEKSILLAHSPDIVEKFKDNERPGLTVCGHTHAGQIAFPWLVKHIPDIMFHVVRKELVWGWFENERMFVTMGLGESSSRARWWVRPEVAILNCVE
jgi:uncharacterized protein